MSEYDNLENKISSPEFKKKNPNNKIMAVVLAMALSSSLTGCGEVEAKQAAAQEVANPQVTTEQSNEIATETPEAQNIIVAPKLENAEIATEFSNGKLIDYAEYPDNLVTGYNFSELDPKSQEWLKEVDSMDLEDFEKLSEQDQLKFADYVFRNNKPGFDARLKQAGITMEYVETPTKRDQLVNRLAYITTFLGSGLYTKDSSNKEAGLVYDDIKAKKLKLLYLDKYAGEYENEQFNWTIDLYDKQASYNLSAYKISVSKSMNAEMSVPDGIFNGILANVFFEGSDIIGSSAGEEQIAIRLVPFTTIDGKKSLNSGLTRISKLELGVNIKDEE